MVEQTSEKNVPVSVKSGRSPIRALQGEMNNMFSGFLGETLPHLWRRSETYMPFGVCPATDVAETDNDFKVTAELPGMEAKDVAVTVSDGYVTIKGEKTEATKKETNGYFRQERSFGEFQRVIALPPNMANAERAEASMSNGVLTITLPKKAGTQSKSRKLDVKQAA